MDNQSEAPGQPLSRREFTKLAATGAAVTAGLAAGLPLHAAARPAATPLTAGEVIARIKANVGVPWFPKTVDNLLTATPETQVRGIATTMMATLDVVERAVAAGKNMIVTHETPFYIHQDRIDDTQSPGGIDLTNDATLIYKQEYCKKHDVALFHFHDHWHAHHPDGIAQGMVEQLGWQQNVNDKADPKKLTFAGEPLSKFAETMATRLNAKTMRVLGDPSLPVRHVQTSWGYMGRETGIPTFAQPGLDVLICGETREWELVEYCQDAIKMGQPKALIVVGHVLSEQGGMMLCAQWLKGFISEVPIDFIPATEPFWNAAYPPIKS